MCVYYAYTSNLMLMLTHKHLVPYSNNLRGCHHRSNKKQPHVSRIKFNVVRSPLTYLTPIRSFTTVRWGW